MGPEAGATRQRRQVANRLKELPSDCLTTGDNCLLRNDCIAKDRQLAQHLKSSRASDLTGFLRTIVAMRRRCLFLGICKPCSRQSLWIRSSHVPSATETPGCVDNCKAECCAVSPRVTAATAHVHSPADIRFRQCRARQRAHGTRNQSLVAPGQLLRGAAWYKTSLECACTAHNRRNSAPG